MGQVLKYVFFAFNFLFWVLGLATLGVGIAARIKLKDYDSLLGNNGSVSTAMNILICAGVFVALIGFLGCCGAIRSNKTMLIIYAALVVLVFILEIAAGALAYTKKDAVVAAVVKTIKEEVVSNYGKAKTTDAGKAIDKAMDKLQTTLYCCGIEGPKDYENNTAWRTKVNETNVALTKVPSSCCHSTKPAVNGACPIGNSQTVGCKTKVEKFLKDHIWQIGGVGIGIAFVQVIGVVVAVVLIRDISHETLG